MTNKLNLIDTHCHPQLGAYNDNREAVIQRSLDQGIGMIIVGTTIADSQAAVLLAERYPDQPVWAAIGVHPTDEMIAGVNPNDLAKLVPNKKVVAIGETGLDYFHVDDPEEQAVQADVFELHILMAGEMNVPMIIHCRDVKDKYLAYDHILVLLKKHRVTKFVMHCYSGDWAHAEQFLDLGGYLSFTGILTFPKSDTMQEVAKKTPLDRIMIETDAPFLAPEPYRGKRNEPAYVQYVADKVAAVRNVAVDEIASVTTANAQTFFRLT